MGTSRLIDLWRNSFIHRIMLKIKGLFMRGLGNSLLISLLLDDSNFYREGRLSTINNNILTACRNIIKDLTKNSLIFNIYHHLSGATLSGVCRLVSITLGAGTISYGILSFFIRDYSIERLLFFVPLGILPLIFGMLDIEMDRVFEDSKFVRLIRLVFDYRR